MVVNGSIVVGTVRTPGAVYTIRTAGDGTYVIRQVDESSLPPPGEPLEEDLLSRDTNTDANDPQADDGSQIDVMVVYTPLVRRQQGGRAAIEALIDLLVTETNQAYENSGVIHRIRLVLREEVDYVEDGDSGIDLDRLANYPDEYMDHIHMLRDLYAADLVHILVGRSDVGGTAQRGGEFGLTASFVGLTFTHELGHNMGLRHDRYSSGVPRTGFRYGYVNQRAFEPGAPVSARWKTIMSYNRQCAQVGGFNCARIPYFSNPDKTYNGDPMGVPFDHSSTGADGPADAARGLNERREATANFRRSSASPTPRVGLTLSPYWLSENGGISRLTATLHRQSTEDTIVTVSAEPSDAVTMSANGTLTITAGETVSTGHVTIEGVDNDDSTGDVIVTVSATVTNTSSLGVIEPEPVELAIADDETTPVVTLVLSPAKIVEGGEASLVTATLDNRSSADTTITVSTTPADPGRRNILWDADHPGRSNDEQRFWCLHLCSRRRQSGGSRKDGDGDRRCNESAWGHGSRECDAYHSRRRSAAFCGRQRFIYLHGGTRKHTLPANCGLWRRDFDVLHVTCSEQRCNFRPRPSCQH